MKAVSLTQPWATLVATGAKKLETRSWRTYHQGPLLIHAASRFPNAARALCYTEPFAETLQRAGYHEAFELPIGAIVGIVTLNGCISTGEALVGIDPAEHAFGDYGTGRFAWQLTQAAQLVQPIPFKGALGLWTVPDEIAESLQSWVAERVA